MEPGTVLKARYEVGELDIVPYHEIKKGGVIKAKTYKTLIAAHLENSSKTGLGLYANKYTDQIIDKAIKNVGNKKPIDSNEIPDKVKKQLQDKSDLLEIIFESISNTQEGSLIKDKIEIFKEQKECLLNLTIAILEVNKTILKDSDIKTPYIDSLLILFTNIKGQTSFKKTVKEDSNFIFPQLTVLIPKELEDSLNKEDHAKIMKEYNGNNPKERYHDQFIKKATEFYCEDIIKYNEVIEIAEKFYKDKYSEANDSQEKKEESKEITKKEKNEVIEIFFKDLIDNLNKKQEEAELEFIEEAKKEISKAKKLTNHKNHEIKNTIKEKVLGLGDTIVDKFYSFAEEAKGIFNMLITDSPLNKDEKTDNNSNLLDKVNNLILSSPLLINKKSLKPSLLKKKDGSPVIDLGTLDGYMSSDNDNTKPSSTQVKDSELKLFKNLTLENNK